MRREFIQLLAVVAIVYGGGCQASREHLRDTSLKYHAHRAYSESNASERSGPYPRDFRAGWEQGYYNVSIGFDPCPPSVPPERYWGTRFDTPAGRERVDAWFRGYQYGAAAAVCEQRDQQNELPTGPSCSRPQICESADGHCGVSRPEVFHLPPVTEEEIVVP